VNNNKKIRSGFKKDGMFNEANPLVFELAKNLRRNMTDAEMILWQHLKAGINGIKFRRQHPIGIYVADFYCHKIKLIIEIDKSIHHKKEIKDYDIKRENDLKSWGYSVIRFSNDKVLKQREAVLAEIISFVQNLNKSSK
jgi:very-short-patch-repair endonuclease